LKEELMLMVIKVRYDGRVFVPEETVDLPAGSEFEVTLKPPIMPANARPPLLALADIARQFPDDPDMPTDAAAQHDHYLYGTPKRP
jgi:Protein of unknown function DUF104